MRSRLIRFITIFLVLFGAASAAIASAPKLTCDSPTFEFGEVEVTQSVEHTFVLKNAGDAAVEITKTEAHCGCTVASLSDKIIPPGSESTLTVSVDLKGQKGHVIKTVDVLSNDPAKPKLTLSMDGMALTSLNIVPDRLLFGRVAQDSTAEKTIELTANRPAVIHVREVTTTCPNLTTSVETVTDGETYRVHVKLKPPISGSGINSSITIKTDRTGYESVLIPVLATVVGEIVVSPVEIVLTDIGQTPVNRYVILSPGKTKDFKITKVDVPLDSIKAEVSAVSAGTYRVRLSNLIANAQLAGKSLKISTDLPSMPTISIPFRVDLPSTRSSTTQPIAAQER